jgi:AraC-like DNA-binding protein
VFYENSKCAYKITGVFYVERAELQHVFSCARKHTAVTYRITGESRFHVGETTLTASAGSVAYFPANVDYERISTPERLIVLHLEGFGEIGYSIEILNGVEELEPLFRKLLQTWETRSPDAYNQSMQLLYGIFELLQKREGEQAIAPPVAILRGIELLKTRYKDPALSVADLANTCFISEVHFRNLFRRHFGRSPHAALAELRFHYACELLSSGYYTQKEIAMYTGFSNVKYFRTAFKKRYGITVSEYSTMENFKKA